MDQKHSISARAPIVRQGVDSFQEQLQTEKESYVISDGVGFDRANFTLTGEENYLRDWFVNGLVRDVKWRGPDGATAWEGYVSRMSLTLGGETITRSIEGMYNRVIYVYAPLDTTANPPTAGAQTTITKNDAASQDKYGIKTILVSGNECTDATADDEALSQLKALRHIKEGRTVTIGRGETPMLRVECSGYAYMIDWYPYTQTANTGTDNANAIIVAVLQADPNGIADPTDVLIDTNTTAIEKYWDGKKTGWNLIRDIAERGYETGGEGFRWTVGIYEGRRVVYKAAEALDVNGNPEGTNKYPEWFRHPYEAGDSILDAAGGEVMPWHIRPDHLLYTSGIPGRPTYIKQVTFDAPWPVRISGEDALNPMRKPGSRIIDQETVDALRSWFFARDRDVIVQPGRTITDPGAIPIGGIILWSGAIVDIPANWHLCDGTAGTVDLQDKFVVGAGSSYAVNDNGGENASDLRHQHGPGTLDTDDDWHSHAALAGTTAEDTHNHDVGGITADTPHAHTGGTLETGWSASHQHHLGTGTDLQAGGDKTTTTDLQGSHIHAMGGGETGITVHNHSAGTLDTDNDIHSHGPGTLSTSGDTHDHTVNAGLTAQAGEAAQENRPEYWALAYIQRIA